MEKVFINTSQVDLIIKLLSSCELPKENESVTHAEINKLDGIDLSNCYFAIVAICHQTSPLGEPRLRGIIGNNEKVGWDYLKEKFLQTAQKNKDWTDPSFWKLINPLELANIYADCKYGSTLNRINERTFLLNDLGRVLSKSGYTNIKMLFDACNNCVSGESGFLANLKMFKAYADPVMKKSQFFVSIARSELKWNIMDPQFIQSPVDYHELRGHLRVGTVIIKNQEFLEKIIRSLPLSEEEDIELRSKIQEINDCIGKECKYDSSTIHYFLWNVFRNCCPRESDKTHCFQCSTSCGLPASYNNLFIYEGKCFFSNFCISAGKVEKFLDPPYIGHYY